jgi:hypothetical protein
MAIGRTANTSKLNLKGAGIKVNPRSEKVEIPAFFIFRLLEASTEKLKELVSKTSQWPKKVPSSWPRE